MRRFRPYLGCYRHYGLNYSCLRFSLYPKWTERPYRNTCQPTPIPTNTPANTPTPTPTNTPAPTHTPTPTNTPTSTSTPELLSVIAVGEILVGLQKFYLGGQLEKDLEHAYLCVVWREAPTNRTTIDELANLVQSYPRGYLPEPFSQAAKHFRDFSREEIEFWCGAMKQNIEERLLARAWDFVRYRRNEGEHVYRADLGRWLNVATGMFDWVTFGAVHRI